jgi:hypothetical protein
MRQIDVLPELVAKLIENVAYASLAAVTRI